MKKVIVAISLLTILRFAPASAAETQSAGDQPKPVALTSAQNVFADPARIATILQSDGYAARIEKDKGEDPIVSSSSRRAKWSVYFYGCTNHENCRTIQFRSSFSGNGKFTIEQVNTWNLKQRFATAVLDKEGSLRLKMDMHLAAGSSEDAFKANLNVWDAQLGEFLQYIEW